MELTRISGASASDIGRIALSKEAWRSAASTLHASPRLAKSAQLTHIHASLLRGEPLFKSAAGVCRLQVSQIALAEVVRVLDV